MKIVHVFDAVKDGTYDDFISMFDGNVNQVNKYTKLNLLETAVANDNNANDKKKIIRHLISCGIDINFVDAKFKRNALHSLFFNIMRGTSDYYLEVSQILVDAGIDINQTDKFGSIPLKYAITLNKLSTDDMKAVYLFLLKSGSDYNHKDKFDKSCLDYANEYYWRNGFVELVKEP